MFESTLIPAPLRIEVVWSPARKALSACAAARGDVLARSGCDRRDCETEVGAARVGILIDEMQWNPTRVTRHSTTSTFKPFGSQPKAQALWSPSGQWARQQKAVVCAKSATWWRVWGGTASDWQICWTASTITNYLHYYSTSNTPMPVSRYFSSTMSLVF